jgi:hypothetical protein
MGRYVNELLFPRHISGTEQLPFNVTFSVLPATASANELVSCRRYTYGVEAGPVDISTLVAISANVATLADLWLDTETSHPAGDYRVQFVCRQKDLTIVEEANVLITVDY